VNRWTCWQPCARPCTPGDLGRARWCSPAGWACGFAPRAGAGVEDEDAAAARAELLARVAALNGRVARLVAERRFARMLARGPRS